MNTFDSESEKKAFRALTTYIEDELGFPTSHYNERYLVRRIQSRMRRTRTNSFSEYHQHVQNDTFEQDELVESFSINVTGFFRNVEVWDEIRGVLHSLMQEKDGKIRVWSAACADGREPYSLALLALSDPKIDADRMEILATDINSTALETAQHGLYEQTATQNIQEQLSYLNGFEQYVGYTGEVFVVGESVKDLVTFKEHDLINGRELDGFDLVMCRNLLIYIDSEHERQLLTRLAGAINTDGYLVIGKAETIPSSVSDLFSIVNTRSRVYQLD